MGDSDTLLGDFVKLDSLKLTRYVADTTSDILIKGGLATWNASSESVVGGDLLESSLANASQASTTPITLQGSRFR